MEEFPTIDNRIISADLALPDGNGNLAISIVEPSSTLCLKKKGHVTYRTLMDASTSCQPQPLIPVSIWDRVRLSAHTAAHRNTYVSYEEVVAKWVPSCLKNEAFGQFAVVDTRLQADDLEDMLRRAIWITDEVDLGRQYTCSGALPFCLPVSSTDRGTINDNPIKVVLYVTRSGYQEAAKLGSLTTTTKLALSTSPIDLVNTRPAAFVEKKAALKIEGTRGGNLPSRRSSVETRRDRYRSGSARWPARDRDESPTPGRRSFDLPNRLPVGGGTVPAAQDPDCFSSAGEVG
ncbi:putative movement protein [Cassava virus C]|uniref:Putative movement protein n=1 Tax=Cassava virus C TaxID=561576 RepID=B5U1W7_9VIRU|nr:putative movement protein [Cassava virus C]ACI03054.1 putative movement protein [Cassava virus C]